MEGYAERRDSYYPGRRQYSKDEPRDATRHGAEKRTPNFATPTQDSESIEEEPFIN
jgi:hypothetical protein